MSESTLHMKDASRVMNLLLVGCGRMGERYLEAVRRTADLRVSAVLARSPEQAQSVTQRTGLACYGSPEEVSFRGIDAAIVASPTSTHYGYLARFIGQGLPVLVERPASASAAECDALIHLQAAHPVPVMVGHTLVFSGPFLRLMGLLASRTLRLTGEVAWQTDIQVGSGWDGAAVRGEYLENEFLYNLLLHRVCLLNRLGGASLRSLSVRILSARPFQEQIRAQLQFDRPLDVSWDVRFVATADGERAHIGTDRGELLLQCGHAGDALGFSGPDGARRPIPFAHGTALELQLAAFATFVRRGIPPYEDLRAAAAAQDLAHRIASAVLQDRPAMTVRRLNLNGIARREQSAASYHRTLGLAADDAVGDCDNMPRKVPRLSFPPGVPARTEEVAFLAGLKPVLYLTVPRGEETRYRKSYAALHLLELPYRMRRDTLLDVRERVPDDPDAEEWTDLFISADWGLAERARDIYATGRISDHVEELGRLMGYPACCARWFASLPWRENNTYLRFATLQASPTPRALSPLLNNLYTMLVPFYPCSYQCPAARAFARRLMEQPGFPPGLQACLAHPVLYFDDSRMVVFEGTLQANRIAYSRILVPAVAHARHPKAEAEFIRCFAGRLPPAGICADDGSRLVFLDTSGYEVARFRRLSSEVPAIFDFTGDA